jgi:MarR family transcriptional regulator, organic hydroperoxide resistance regulator
VPDLSRLLSDLVRFENGLSAVVEARLRSECNLTLSRFDVMQVIGSAAPCRVNDIANELGITWGGTSKIVDRLEAARLCRRRANPQDRRSSLIDLTPAGKGLLAKGQRIVEDELRTRIGSALSAPALDQFATALAALKCAADGWYAPERTA